MKHFNFMFIICLNLTLQAICVPSAAQLKKAKKNNFVKFEVAVSFIDSEFILIPKLTVSSKSEKISIPEEIYYHPYNCHTSGDCKFSLQKIVRGRQLNIHSEHVPSHRSYGMEVGYRNFRFGDVLKDTIKLQKYFPLEVGKYRVKLQFFYYYKKKLTFIDTKWAAFEVLAEPVREFGNLDKKRE